MRPFRLPIRPCAVQRRRRDRPPSPVKSFGRDRIVAARRLLRARTRRGRCSARAATDCCGARASGGRGSSSSWCTLLAPCRWAVPRQSAPVSPPPMMMTCLSSRGDEPSRDFVAFAAPVLQRQVLHREVDALRARARAPADRAAPSSRRRARWRRTALQLRRAHVDADVGIWSGTSRPLRASARAGDREPLLHLELGDAVAQQPADAIGALEHRDECPARFSCSAAASPAGPEPTTATRLPVRTCRRPWRRPSLRRTRAR